MKLLRQNEQVSRIQIIARARWSFKLLRGYARIVTGVRLSKTSSIGWCMVPKKWINNPEVWSVIKLTFGP
ncbi:hypothetical protein CC77DRAFT_357932 [Alternaria alternata]|uniref:Uncharacterized protein n=1 Tax=Alternaria alternata TaxID=5599 RepID=A0A177DCB3_ALTAL|nr:hypothetical protein CC77DRAFT_357932 [Alternaria alternata]OAG16837.1 hypothetical protein CC77DRAFT_357932 [Alternaria alternata]